MATATVTDHVTISRTVLKEIAETIDAAANVFNELAGCGPAPGATDPLLAILDPIEEALGITWDGDAHLSNPDWLEIQHGGERLAASILAAIVADPDERLIPRDRTRRELIDAARRLDPDEAAYDV